MIIAPKTVMNQPEIF